MLLQLLLPEAQEMLLAMAVHPHLIALAVAVAVV